ncbi:MAG: hypothetical protein R3Y26_01025 [Rikenellaceae bacterium]
MKRLRNHKFNTYALKGRVQIYKDNLRREYFRIGDLYLFHTTNPLCPAEESLWGMYDKQCGEVIHLESSTSDLRHFQSWHKLPSCYRYVRLATRAELRDYMFNLGWYESDKRTLQTTVSSY